MATWGFAIGPWRSSTTLALVDAHDRKVTFRRREGSSAAFTIDGRKPAASSIDELVTDLRVSRDGVVLFRGRVGPTSDDLDTDQHNTTLTVGDYRSVLDRRYLYDNDPYVGPPFTDDAADLVAALIDLVQGRTAGDLGITFGQGFPAGRIATDIKFRAGQSIRQAIDALADTDADTTGFDWDIDPNLVLDIWPGGRGRPTGEVLDYGGSVTKVKRTIDPSNYANTIRGNGSTDAGIARTIEVDDLLTRPEGRWESQVGFTEVNTFPLLAEALAREEEMRSTMRPAYTVTLKAGWWRGPEHLWLGDTARLVIRSGRVQVDSLLTVESISVAISDDSDETTEVVLSSDFPGFTRRFSTLEDRIAVLERN